MYVVSKEHKDRFIYTGSGIENMVRALRIVANHNMDIGQTARDLETRGYSEQKLPRMPVKVILSRNNGYYALSFAHDNSTKTGYHLAKQVCNRTGVFF